MAIQRGALLLALPLATVSHQLPLFSEFTSRNCNCLCSHPHVAVFAVAALFKLGHSIVPHQSQSHTNRTNSLLRIPIRHLCRECGTVGLNRQRWHRYRVRRQSVQRNFNVHFQMPDHEPRACICVGGRAAGAYPKNQLQLLMLYIPRQLILRVLVMSLVLLDARRSSCSFST